MTGGEHQEVIMGLDPGFATTGFAILAFQSMEKESSSLALSSLSEIAIIKACGVIRTSTSLSFVERLIEIETNLVELIRSYHPTSAAIEKLYFAVNKKSALDVAHARGLMLKTLYDARLPIGEYTPLQVKKAVTGHGKASKVELQGMVARLLNMKDPIVEDNAADALAIALCHSYAISKIFNYV